METVDARMAASIFSEGMRRENENRKEAVAKMFDADDATVRHFWQAWQAGGFCSFEDMLCRLVVVLVEEKKTFHGWLVDGINNRANSVLIPKN